MAIYYPDTFKYSVIADWFATNTACTMHLLTSANAAYTLSYAFQFSSYLASESQFAGYSAQNVSTPTVTNDTTNHQVIITFATATFSYNSADSGNTTETVDGWCITDDTFGTTIACGPISPGKVVSTNGDQIIITFSTNMFEDVAGSIDPVS